MHHSLPYKTKQFFFVLIKLSIVVGAGYFIFQKLIKNPDLNFHSFIDFASKNAVFSLKNMFFLLILSFFNWFFEILKWQHLVSEVKTITFKDALEQSLSALTASLFTPNRIGEYGAKAIYYKPQYRKRIMLVNLLSNMLQMCVTVVMGIIGFTLYINTYDIDINYYKVGRFLIITLTIALLTIFGVKQRRLKIKGFALNRIKDFLLDFPRNKLVHGFLLSLMRYLMFSFQFYTILLLFKVDIPYLDAMYVITSMYFIASIVPSIFIFDAVIKGSIAVYLFSFLNIDALVILCTITLMWSLNFMLPSIFGSFYVLNFKVPETN